MDENSQSAPTEKTGEMRACKHCKKYCLQIKEKHYGKTSYKYVDGEGKLWYSARICPKCRARARRKSKDYDLRDCVICKKQYQPHRFDQKTCGDDVCKEALRLLLIKIKRANRRLSRGMV